jgi:DNA repair protein RecO (recombination protein O)
MAINKTDAIVLSKRDFRETSVIANFYTRDFGKMTGLLKGLRTEPAKFASSVEPFSYNEIVFYQKRNSALHLVSQCDLKEDFYNLKKDLPKLSLCSLIMELVSEIMPPEDKNESVFDLILDTLKEIDSNNNPYKVTLLFKIKILALSGFKPHFDSCVSCGSKINGESKFSLSLGGLLCLKCFKKDTGARQIFRGTIATVIYIQKNDFKTNMNLGLNPQIKKELEIIVNSFLNFHLEKQLKSEQVINKLIAEPQENFAGSKNL